jgi:hypothetical protein
MTVGSFFNLLMDKSYAFKGEISMEARGVKTELLYLCMQTWMAQKNCLYLLLGSLRNRDI